jgi:hypothetical protein
MNLPTQDLGKYAILNFELHGIIIVQIRPDCFKTENYIHYAFYKHLRTCQKVYCAFIITSNRRMPYRKRVAVYCKKHRDKVEYSMTKCMDFGVKPDGTPRLQCRSVKFIGACGPQ